MLPRTQPRNLDDLAVQVAIVRPGPIVGGAVNPYVQRRASGSGATRRYRPRADHPLLDELLRDTLGVVLYQDQVLEVAMRMGGFTAGQADQFRRAMSRRRSRGGWRASGTSSSRGAAAARRDRGDGARRSSTSSWRSRSSAFPKSHAYAFAILAYQSAWLRTTTRPSTTRRCSTTSRWGSTRRTCWSATPGAHGLRRPAARRSTAAR